MKNKKIIWIVLLIIGILAFAVPLTVGIYDSINGFGGLCFIACEKYYGFDALKDSIILYSYILWPTYIIGIILMIISIIKIKTKK